MQYLIEFLIFFLLRFIKTVDASVWKYTITDSYQFPYLKIQEYNIRPRRCKQVDLVP